MLKMFNRMKTKKQTEQQDISKRGSNMVCVYVCVSER